MVLSAEQRKKKQDRAFARRERAKLNGSAVDVDTGERYEVAILDSDSKRTKRLAPVVSQNLKTLRAPVPSKVREKLVVKRARYAAMKTHMEIAAIAIAAGATPRMAARKAGVNKRQISKYMQNADFRERVHEFQELLGNRILGRVLKEVNRRTEPEVIKKMELLDLLRVGDRVGLGRGSGSTIINNEGTINNYEANFNALFHEGAEDSEQLSDPSEEGADFPEFKPTSLALSGGDSQE
jgi:hypothetical protein